MHYTTSFKIGSTYTHVINKKEYMCTGYQVDDQGIKYILTTGDNPGETKYCSPLELQVYDEKSIGFSIN